MIHNDNVLVIKSKAFAIRIVNLAKHLQGTKSEHVLSKQILRCGTSIGANVHEAEVSMSKSEFIAKLNISLKECHETLYWIELLHETDYLSSREFNSIFADCLELKRILIAIIKSSKNNK